MTFLTCDAEQTGEAAAIFSMLRRSLGQSQEMFLYSTPVVIHLLTQLTGTGQQLGLTPPPSLGSSFSISNPWDRFVLTFKKEVLGCPVGLPYRQDCGG